jgi:TP901 family phage tail tape measure protein
MANRIDIPISYSPGSIDQILKDFDAIIKQADISDVFAKDQDKIRAQFANIAATIKEQLASGNIDLTKVNFTGLEKDIEDFARKVAFVLNEAFEKEVEPYAKKITAITDEIVNKQKEISDLNQKMADIGGKERDDFKAKYGLNRMPTLDKGEAKRRLGAAEEELQADPGNTELQKKVELYRELLEMLSTEKQRKKEIQDQISKKEVEVLNLTNQKKAVQIDLDKAQAKLGADAANYSQKLLDLNRLLIVAKENGIDLSEEQIKLLKEQAEAVDKDTNNNKKNEKSLIARAGASFSYGLILGQLRQAFRATLRTVLELDKAMTEAAIVTEMNREEAYKLLGAYQQLARETGLATSEVSGIVVEFLKQGRTMNEAMELAKVAAMSAKVAGIDAREAVDYLTSAVNGFQLAAAQAKDVADKFAAISAASATDFEELAIAMSKVAPVAYTAGVGVDFMMGVLAKGLETTREAPENIGTAFKTIFARMREVTDIGKATEDGMSLNRVEKALASIGVPLRDVTGQFRNLEQVLIDVGNKWDTLTTIEQAYIATALAGTRQQPRLLAIFNDFARTKELIQISTDATGQLAFQHMEYMEGAAAALSQLKTAWEGFIMAFTDTNMVVGSINLITDFLNGVTSVFENLGDSAFRNAALIGLVGMAFVAMAPKYASNLMLQTEDIAIKQMLRKATDEVQKEYDELSNSITKATGAQREMLIAERQAFLNKNNLKLSIGATTKAIIASVGAMAKAMLITAAWTIAIGLVVWGLTALWNWITEISKGSKELSKDIDKNNKALNDLATKEKSIKNLVEEFDKLQRKVVKTSEDLARLKTIAEELGEVKVGDQTFQLARVDITGQATLDKAAYEAFVASVENQRQELLTKNMDAFTRALAKDGVRAFEQFTIAAMARDIGYGFSIDFLNGMKEGMTEDQVSSVMQKLRAGANKIAPDLFTKITFKSTASNYRTEGLDVRLTTLLAGAKTLEEMTQRIKDQLSLQGLVEGSTEFNEALTIALNSLKSITTAEFDEDKAKEFAEKFTNILVKASNYVEANSGPDSTLAEKLKANLDSYTNALKDAESLTGNEKTVILNFLSESMYDEAVLDMLVNEMGIELPVVVKMIESGSSFDELNNLVQSVRDSVVDLVPLLPDLTSWVDTEHASGGYFETYSKDLNEINRLMGLYSDALSAAFDPNDPSYTTAYNLINQIFGTGTEEAIRQINALSNSLGLLNSTTAATAISDQGKNIQDLLKLPEQIAKGDFSKYSDMVAAFGEETVNKLLKGGTASLTDFFAENKKDFEDEINKSIENIKAQFYATNEAGTQLGAAQQEQIAQLQLMLSYYDQIAGVEQFRAAKVKEVKDLLKETNDLYALQEKLSKGGMSADNPFMKLLDKLTNASESEALSKLGAQLQSDINKLNSLGKFVDGQFIRDSNVNINETELATKNMMETLTQLIDVQTAAYNKQAKVIEERYKTELDAMKSAHDEKWSQIDYNNKLLETEEKIIDARRQLMGLALSGAMRGEYKDAQKALENLQREREKTIETQMLDDAQKQLEQQRNDDLIKAQTEFTKAIEGYTNTIEGLAPLLVPGSQARVTPENIAIKFDSTKQSLDILTSTLDQLNMDSILQNQKTGELIDVNTLMIDQMADLIATIENWKIKIGTTTSPSGVDTDGLGT